MKIATLGGDGTGPEVNAEAIKVLKAVFRWAHDKGYVLANPAASSAARLMRNPDESFSRLLPIRLLVPDRLRLALNAMTLLLIRMSR